MSRYGELSIHRWMLRDERRNEAYRRALEHVVRPGDVVLDVGAGTGILSIFAASSGARKVYAVERTQIADVARRMVERNGHTERIEIIQTDLEDLAIPEQVDVIVSEWMGGFGVDENMLAPLVMARNRWLKPGGKMVPGRVTASLAPASSPEFDEEIAYWRSRPHGVDTSVIAAMTTHETFHTQTPLTPDSLVAAPQVLWSHDPYTCSLEEADRPFTAKLTFEAPRPGAISGFAAWFTAEMGDGETLTNAVGAPGTHWGRTWFPLDRAVEVAAGESFDIELHCDPSAQGSCEFYWSVKIANRPLEEHDTRRARRDRALSGLAR
jgi:predicted RNA methylase